MITLVPNPSGKFVQGQTASDDYHISLIEKTILTGEAVPSIVVDKDITHTSLSSEVTWLMDDIEAVNGLGNPDIVFSTLTPSVCLVEPTGGILPVAAGICKIRATGQTGKREINSYVVAQGAGTAYTGTVSIEEGSLRKYLVDQQLAAISGVVPGSDTQRANAVASNVGTGDAGSVNENCFIRAQDRTGFDAMPQEALDEVLAGGTNPAQWRAWISPHHFLTWRGHNSTSGTTWRSLNGEHVVEYSAEAWGGGTSARLCKTLPKNYLDYLPNAAKYTPAGGYAPEINVWVRFFNTYLPNDRRWVMPIRASPYFAESVPGYLVYTAPDPRNDFIRINNSYNLVYNPVVVGGDSGSPVFAGLKGTLVILDIVTSKGTVPATGCADLHDEINAAMAELDASGVYTVQTVDLGPTGMNFTSYA